MATLETQRMTLEEFQALPEGPPFYEFEEGELILMASPRYEHQDVIDEISGIVRPVIRAQRLGKIVSGVDVFLPDGRVFIPDLTFVEAAHRNLFDPTDGKIHGVPTLVVEVTSSDEARDRVHKFQVYYDNGVPWYWLIAQETLAIEEYRWTPQGYVRVASVAAGDVFRPQLFPGVDINLQTLLEEIQGEQA